MNVRPLSNHKDKHMKKHARAINGQDYKHKICVAHSSMPPLGGKGRIGGGYTAQEAAQEASHSPDAPPSTRALKRMSSIWSWSTRLAAVGCWDPMGDRSRSSSLASFWCVFVYLTTCFLDNKDIGWHALVLSFRPVVWFVSPPVQTPVHQMKRV